MSNQLSSLLFLVVGLSMAITPWLAAGGQLLASRFDQQDVRSLLPAESEVGYSNSQIYVPLTTLFNSTFIVNMSNVCCLQTDDLQGHILICGFGRVGQVYYENFTGVFKVD